MKVNLIDGKFDKKDYACSPTEVAYKLEWGVNFLFVIEKIDFFVVKIGGPTLPKTFTLPLWKQRPFPGKWGKGCLSFKFWGNKPSPSPALEKQVALIGEEGLPDCSTYTNDCG